MKYLDENLRQQIEQILLGTLPFDLPQTTNPYFKTNYMGSRKDKVFAEWLDFLIPFLEYKEEIVQERCWRVISEWLPKFGNIWYLELLSRPELPISYKEKLLAEIANSKFALEVSPYNIFAAKLWEKATRPKEAFLNTIAIFMKRKSWISVGSEIRNSFALTFNQLPFEWEDENEAETVRTKLAKFFPNNAMSFAIYFPWGKTNEKWETWAIQRVHDSISRLSNSAIDEWNSDWNHRHIEMFPADIKKIFTDKQEELTQSRKKRRMAKLISENRKNDQAKIEQTIKDCLDHAQKLREFSASHPDLHYKKSWRQLWLEIGLNGLSARQSSVYILLHYLEKDKQLPNYQVYDRHVYTEIYNHLQKRFNQDDINFFGRLQVSLVKIEYYFKELKNREEQRRHKAEEHKVAEQKRQQDKQEERERSFQYWQNLIEQRCRQIVNIFNGIFDADISPDAVLDGEVSGTFASIQSGGSSYPSLGQSLRLNQTLALRQFLSLDLQTHLMLEEGDDEKEWQATYRSTNFLVWHELCHLVSPALIDSLVKQILDHTPDYSELVDAQAREVVIDGLAIRFGETFYVHSDTNRMIATADQRRNIMLRSHAEMVNRVIRWYRKKEQEDGDDVFLSRLESELKIHSMSSNEPQFNSLRQSLRRLRPNKRLHFDELYQLAQKCDPQTVLVRQSLADTEEDQEQFNRSNLELVKTA